MAKDSDASGTNNRNYLKFGRAGAPKGDIGFVNTLSNGRGDLLFMNNDDNGSAEFGDSDEVIALPAPAKLVLGRTHLMKYYILKEAIQVCY